MTLHHVLPLALAAVATQTRTEQRHREKFARRRMRHRRPIPIATASAIALIATPPVRPFAGTDARLMFDGGHVITQLDDLTDEYSLLIGEYRLIYGIGVGVTLEVLTPAALRSNRPTTYRGAVDG